MPLAKKPSAAGSIHLQFCSSFLFILQTETRLILPKYPFISSENLWLLVIFHCYRIYPLTSFSVPFSFSHIGGGVGGWATVFLPPNPKTNVSHSLLLLPHSKSHSFSRFNLCSALIYLTSFIIHITHFFVGF